jgi:hypothetical protein
MAKLHEKPGVCGPPLGEHTSYLARIEASNFIIESKLPLDISGDEGRMVLDFKRFCDTVSSGSDWQEAAPVPMQREDVLLMLQEGSIFDPAEGKGVPAKWNIAERRQPVYRGCHIPEWIASHIARHLPQRYLVHGTTLGLLLFHFQYHMLRQFFTINFIAECFHASAAIQNW